MRVCWATSIIYCHSAQTSFHHSFSPALEREKSSWLIVLLFVVSFFFFFFFLKNKGLDYISSNCLKVIGWCCWDIKRINVFMVNNINTHADNNWHWETTDEIKKKDRYLHRRFPFSSLINNRKQNKRDEWLVKSSINIITANCVECCCCCVRTLTTHHILCVCIMAIFQKKNFLFFLLLAPRRVKKKRKCHVIFLFL